jgi:hypothetical protein
MKKHTLILKLSVWLGLTLAAATLSAAPVKYPVSFPGTWTTVGRATVQASPNSVVIANGFAMSKETWKDCVFTFQGKAAKGDGQVQIWGGIRVKDNENRYVVGLRGGAETELSFARYAADGQSKFLGWVPLDFKPEVDKYYTIRVAVSGKRFQVYLNDEKLPRINIEDSDALWDEGGVALGGGWLPTEFTQPVVEPLTGAKLTEFQSVGDKVWTAPELNKEDLRKQQRAAYQPAKIDKLPELRGSVSLDGNWLFMPDQDNANLDKSGAADANDESWHIMPVPAFWTMTLGWLHGELGLPGLKEAQASKGPSDMLIAEEYARLDKLTFNWRKTRSAWYRHYVDLPADLKGRHVELVFDAVAKISEVWVNGTKVGNNVGMFRQVRCDVTQYLKPGKNVIAVHDIGNPDNKILDAKKVADIAQTVEVTNEMLNSLPHGMTDNNSGGIWQPVRLEVTSPVRVSDLYIQPALDGMNAEIELANSDSKEHTVSLGFTISDVKDQSALFKGAQPLTVKIPANGTATAKIATSGKLQPKLWTPSVPNLYVLGLTLNEGSNVLDKLDTRFGFRTFGVDGGKLMLNGKPYYLRGGNHFPVTLRPNDGELAKRFMTLAREGNVLVTRSHGIPFTETWFDAADELGMGVSYEGTWPWLMLQGPVPEPGLIKVWKDEFSTLIKRYRNHPSLLFWTVNNEMFFASRTPEAELLKQKWEVLDDIIKTIRQIDATRPVVPYSGYTRHETEKQSGEVRAKYKYDDGDIDDVHSYYGWYNESPFNLFDGKFGKRQYTPGRPLISQEMSTGYPRNDDWPSRSYQFPRYVPQALVGNFAFEQNDPNIFMTRQAFMTKELAEVIRRSNREECAGILYFAYLTWFTDVWKADSIKPKLTYYELKTALQPVLVSAELYGRHFYAGETAQRRVCVINDSEDDSDVAAGTLNWEIRAGDKVLAQGRQATPAAPYYSNQWIDVDFAMPSTLPTPRVNAKLFLKLNVGGRDVSANSYDIVLATRDWAAAPNDGGQLYDPQGKSKDVTGNLGLSTVSSPANFDSGKLLVIGDAGALLKAPQGAEKLKAFVEAGGRVLLLQSGKDLVSLFPEQVKSYRSIKGEIVSMLVPESPVFDGIEPLDTAWFEMGRGNLPQACSGTYEVDRTKGATPLALECRLHPDIKPGNYFKDAGAPIIELKIGKGTVIASEMMFNTKDNDPVAGRLLANMLRYLK